MTDHDESDHYEQLCKAMQPGLLLTVNESDQTATPYDEMEVDHVDEDSGTVTLKGWNSGRYRIRHDSPRHDTIIEEITEDGYGGRENAVTTIEVVGIAE